MTIWKFTINPNCETISMPAGAMILSCQVQDRSICLWARVDPSAPLEERRIKLYATGGEDPPIGAAFIDTIQIPPYVFHVFDEGVS